MLFECAGVSSEVVGASYRGGRVEIMVDVEDGEQETTTGAPLALRRATRFHLLVPPRGPPFFRCPTSVLFFIPSFVDSLLRTALILFA